MPNWSDVVRLPGLLGRKANYVHSPVPSSREHLPPSPGDRTADSLDGALLRIRPLPLDPILLHQPISHLPPLPHLPRHLRDIPAGAIQVREELHLARQTIGADAAVSVLTGGCRALGRHL